jgi:putative ABC transport system permease protein
VKTERDAKSLIPELARTLRELDKAVELGQTNTLEDFWANSLSGQQLLMVLLAIFAGIAASLAMIGLYGVVAYSTAQRVREIGIRLALGAERADVLRLIVGQGMRLVLAGLVLGLIVAAAATRVLRNLLYSVSPTDAITFLVTSLFLLMVALLACYLPARRASRINPVEALRYE